MYLHDVFDFQFRYGLGLPASSSAKLSGAGSFLFVANQVLDCFACLVAFRSFSVDHCNNVGVLDFAELQGVLLIGFIIVALFDLVAGMRFALRLFLIFY